MPLDKPIFIIRRKPIPGDDDIPLDEWVSYVDSSPTFRAKVRISHRGANPFTKIPFTFHAPPGNASFEGPNGQCEVEYHAGGLIVHNAHGHAEALVSKIAQDLGASVEFYDPNAGTTGGA